MILFLLTKYACWVWSVPAPTGDWREVLALVGLIVDVAVLLIAFVFAEDWMSRKKGASR